MKKALLISTLLISTTSFAEKVLLCKTDDKSKTKIEVTISGKTQQTLTMKVNYPLAGLKNEDASARHLANGKIGGGEKFVSDLGSLSVNMTTSPQKDGSRIGNFNLAKLNQDNKLGCKYVDQEDAATEEDSVSQEDGITTIKITGKKAEAIYESIETEALKIMSVPEKSVHQKIGEHVVCTASQSKAVTKLSKIDFSCELKLRNGSAIGIGQE